MEAKSIVLGILFLFLGFIDSVNAQKNSYVPKAYGAISVDDGTKLLSQCSRSIPRKIKSYFEVTREQITNLEENFKKVLLIEAKECCYPGKVEDLNKFIYQYIGVIKKKKKYIYINAIHHILLGKKESEEMSEWIKEPRVYCDGGQSYWGVLYDLEQKCFKELSFNGI